MNKESKGTTNRLLLYLEGKLASDQRYEVEQTLLRDPLAQAALDGLGESGLSGVELQNDLICLISCGRKCELEHLQN